MFCAPMTARMRPTRSNPAGTPPPPPQRAPPRDDARGEGVSVRAVLHLGAAHSRGQDTAAARPGAAASARSARPSTRAGRDPPHDLAEMGRQHRVDLVPGRGSTRDARWPPPTSTSAPGDSWAIDEVTSAMRRGDGNSRANLREFLRGLYDAGGEGPPTKGVVWVVGIGQRVSEVGTYKARTQEWLQDSAFWSDVNAVRQRLVAGGVRRHSQLRRARHGDDRPPRRARRLPAPRRPPGGCGRGASGTANAFFDAAASPLANAAYQWDFGFGYTLVEQDLMQHFVSAQVYALRSHSVRSARPVDHWGSRGHRGTPRRFPLPTGRR